MKATGIVRRIDELGRIVIPKEIRRTMRIREGDPLEIYTDRDGEVIFKKYSPIGELTTFAAQYAEAMSRACGCGVLVTDRDAVVAVAGGSKKELLERRLSEEYEQFLERRRLFAAEGGAKPLLCVEGAEESAVRAAAPIIAEGDLIGSVAILGGGKETGDEQLLQTAAGFLARQME